MTLVESAQEAELLDDDVDLSTLSLDELAARVNDDHALVESHVAQSDEELRRGLLHAIAAGESLMEVRRRYPAGDVEYEPWLEANTNVSVGQARIYVRFAFYKSELSGAASKAAALKLLAGLPRVPRVGGGLSSDVLAEVRVMHKQGMPKKDIAELLNVSLNTVCRETIPGYRERERDTERAWRAQQKAARKALAEKQKAEAIKKAGGNISTAYGYVRKAAVELDAALSDATSPEVRAALRAALAGVHKAEDEIGKAVRA